MKSLKLKNFDVEFSYKKPIVLIAGINVLESRDLALKACEKFKEVCDKEKLPYVFKASFDKANRSSIHSYRGPGLEEGLKIFQEVKEQFNVPVLTDYHEPDQAAPLSEVVDILQIPAFLSRQTDLVVAGAKTGCALHVKKAQFLSPWEMKNIKKKCEESGNDQLLFCERGSSFGYNNLIVDMLGMLEMKQEDLLVTFDVTHALQLPGGKGTAAGGRRQFSLPFARSGVALGLAGLFLESHPNPEEAKCDGPSALPFDQIDSFVKEIAEIDRLVKSYE
jgi:2-dehydro-3-deoxyphosphooctonate aldolase (KDO 8-P synthase)